MPVHEIKFEFLFFPAGEHQREVLWGPSIILSVSRLTVFEIKSKNRLWANGTVRFNLRLTI